MKPFHVWLAAALLVAPLAQARASDDTLAFLAGPIPATYFFGDSLSDAGNVAARLPLDEIPGALPGKQGSFYWQGRFSNGPTWADRLAKALGTDSTASAFGGPNYAAGGAHNVRPNGNPAFSVFFDVPGWLLSEQIDEYLDQGDPADPDALYVVFMGSNDVGVGGATDPAPGVAEVVEAVERLHAAGARRFFVWSLFPFVVPGFEGLAAYANGFNALLPAALDSLESLPGIVITRGDNVAAIGAVLADPAAFGFTNAGGFFEPTACTALGYPAPPFGGNPACQQEAVTDTFFGRPIGDTYLFHDGIHFTTRMQTYWTHHALVQLCTTRVEERVSGKLGERLAKLLCK
jgi:phospholipase/lecithinase/hemolysin